MFMGRTSKISPLGLYNWDDTIFDLFVIPEELERDTLIDNLLMETAELEVVYPNPTVFKNLLGIWSHRQLEIWQRLYATTQYEYNPIENYNRYETGSEDGEGTTIHSGTDQRVIDKDRGGSDANTGKTEQGNWIAGFDSTASGDDDGLVKKTREEGEGTSTTYYGSTEDITDNLTHGERIASSNEGSHELHAHGNIGVTTTQKLIREQRDIEQFNLYDIIIENFKMKFCILVY